MMIFAGFPMFYLELLIGQYTGKPPHILYTSLSPIFKGLGYCMILITTYMSIYYNMVVGWAILYFGFSFFPKLPYAQCTEWWNNDHCYSAKQAQDCAVQNTTFFRGECLNTTNATEIAIIKGIFEVAKESPSSQFWNYRVLRIADSISVGGAPQWDLTICLLVAWVIVAIFLSAGIKSAGKTVYFTTTFPYIVILILVIRGCTLSNSIDGIKFYILPDWSKLQNAQVWVDAAVQIFFSLSVGIGGLGTLASYNHFHNNALRDTVIVVIGNCLTSFFAGFAIFPILGHLAHLTNSTVSDIAAEGPGLTFVAYPSGISEIPVPQLWSVLFFFMLILLGINTEQVNTEVIITAIVDTFPNQLRRPIPRFCVTASVCATLFLAGLSMCTPSGIYVLNLLDKFAAGWPIIVVAITEVITVSWIYGIWRFLDDIKLMMGVPKNLGMKIVGYPVNIYWVLNWTILTWALLLFVLIFSFVNFEKIKYNDILYPDYAQNLGWVISISTLVPLILFMLIQIQQWIWSRINHETPITVFKPDQNWLPNIPRRKDTGDDDNVSVATIEKMEDITPGQYTEIKFPTVQLSQNGGYENKAFEQTKM